MHTGITEFAPAKINLALHVIGRRMDGYHELDSIVTFADVGDELHIVPGAKFSITASGPFAHLLPAPKDNIVFAAYEMAAHMVAARGIKPPSARVELVKNLPVAAGIGGGSADAAATLRGYLRFAGIGKTGDEISAAALALGADVPVCLAGRACRMRGMGERLTPLQDFKPLHAVLVNPMIEVQTSAVFGKLELAKGEGHGASLAGLRDATGWRNDLTAPALALAPAIAVVIQAVENREGLRFARMSGSGPTCFGVFENPDAAREAARAISASHPQWWVRRATLS